MSVFAACIAACALTTACSSAGDGDIHRFAPAFDALVPPGARIELLADGFGFTEGPLWVDENGGYLLFSDVPGNRIIK